MNKFLLSICISTYNRVEIISKNVKTYLQNLPKRSVELVVCDNGSDDNTFEILNEIKDDRFNLYRNKTNKGFSYNLSKVIRLAKGDFTLIISDEDMINFNNLKYLLDFISENDTKDNITGIVFNSSFETDENTTKTDEFLNLVYGRVSYMSGIVYNRLKMEKDDFVPFKSYYPHMGIILNMCCKGRIIFSKLPIFINGEESKMSNMSTYMYPEQRLEQIDEDLEMVLTLKDIEPNIKFSILIEIFYNKFRHIALNYELIIRDREINLKDIDKNIDVDFYIKKAIKKYKEIFYSDLRDNSFLELKLNNFLEIASRIRNTRKKYDVLKNKFNYVSILFIEDNINLYNNFLELEKFNFNADYVIFDERVLRNNYESLELFIKRLNNIIITFEDVNQFENLLFILDNEKTKNIEMLKSLNVKNIEIINIQDLHLKY